ncbi:MAG: prepilin-type N-terminal cleavage/methylation domain-containing protein [Candidatus Magasanikbacteria bacterium]|nr:prepilin-type N-terminal cleavage/methylation domain-containing protein [Candidatus Magasanikbacteria bacterium]
MLKSKKGFTLIEILVSVAIFAMIMAGVYAVIMYVFKLTYISRVRVLETQIANEYIEIIRNLPYENVGTVGGVPNGSWPAVTSTLRNGVNFSVNTTIRNVDDPADGVIGGTPNDTSPADYKLMEVNVTCISCTGGQVKPEFLTARVSPKSLESASKNGSLFIKVFDASGVVVPGATVHIVNNQVSPAINITDVTNATGDLQIVDTATSTEGYSITVTKSGYTSDSTIASSVDNPNPVKPPATVISQTVTNISFSIDKVSTVALSTINTLCNPIASIVFNVAGSKIIGTNPSIFKYNHNITTSGSGTYTLNNLEWDTYAFNMSNGSYDVAGTIPTLPLFLFPDTTQNLSIILKSHTTNSLLVTVKDNGTKLPLTSATITLSKAGVGETLVTGRGYLRQTDWSGGSGQESYIDETKYLEQSGAVETSSPAGDLYLKRIAGKYQWSGDLISSTIDFGAASNFTNIVWEPLSQPPQTGTDSLKFQIATASSTSASWQFLGPDGTASTYYTISDTNISSVHNGDRYLRYKVFLSTTSQNSTPQLSEVAFSYTSGCTPPGQAFFSGLDVGTYDMTIELAGYQTVVTTVDVSGRTQAEVLMNP